MTGFVFFFTEKGSHFLRFSVITALNHVLRQVKKYPHTIFIMYFNKSRDLTIISFFNIAPVLCNTLVPALQKLLDARRKKSLAEQQAAHAPLPSLLRLRWIDGPLRHLYVDQKDGSLWGRDRDCMQDVPTPWNPVSQKFEECGWARVVKQQQNTRRQ